MLDLKNVLIINALSSGLTGIGLIALNKPVASFMGTHNSDAIIGVGIFLFLFALLVLRESRRALCQPKNVRIIIVLDVIWVVASFAVVLLQLFALSTIGYLLIAGVAVWVVLMAFLQRSGLKKMLRTI